MYFSELAYSDNAVLAIRRFLRAKRRLDTLKHVTQVMAAGRRLARRFGLSLAPVDLACTAHDMAAVVPVREIVTVAEQLGMTLAEADRAIPSIVHGPLAAQVLQTRLNVRDEAVLNAVRYHTTLRAEACPLEMLVFIADKIALDPTSRHTDFVPALLATKDTASLSALCRIYVDWAVAEGPRLGWQLHPQLYAAQAWLKTTEA